MVNVVYLYLKENHYPYFDQMVHVYIFSGPFISIVYEILILGTFLEV